ncbi:MAG: hypothetical protein NDJ94_00135 [Vicinamibacteria bacterium]|nr:hypothetical protein [Vicinamibacteria bacterium]
MKPSRVAVALLALIFGAGTAAAFQEPSLAEIAKQEKKRRKAAAKAAEQPTRTITEAELKAAPGTTANPVVDAPAEPGTATPGASPGASPEKTDDQLRDEKRVEIQKKIDEQKERMAKVRKMMDDAQLELNDLSNQTMGGRRTALLKLVDDGTAELAACEARISELEEQARRAGVPVSR